MKMFYKVVSYISSLIPVWVYLAIIFAFPLEFNGKIYRIAFLWKFIIVGAIIGLIIVSILITLLQTKRFLKPTTGNVNVVIRQITPLKDLSYITLIQNTLPVVTLVFSLNYATIAFTSALIIVLGIIWCKNNLYFQNFLFDFMGVRVYTAMLVFCELGNYNMDLKNVVFDECYIVAPKGNGLKDRIYTNTGDSEITKEYYIKATKKDNGIYYISD